MILLTLKTEQPLPKEEAEEGGHGRCGEWTGSIHPKSGCRTYRGLSYYRRCSRTPQMEGVIPWRDAKGEQDILW